MIRRSQAPGVGEGNPSSRGKIRTARQPTLSPPGSARSILREERNACPKINAKQVHNQGTINALKHGFYSQRFSPIELQDLDIALADGLDDEIALLRVTIRRVFDLATEEGEDTETWFKALSTPRSCFYPPG